VAVHVVFGLALPLVVLPALHLSQKPLRVWAHKSAVDAIVVVLDVLLKLIAGISHCVPLERAHRIVCKHVPARAACALRKCLGRLGAFFYEGRKVGIAL
jgi:fumarate reductase subunit D